MEAKDFINIIAENEMKKELLKLVKDFNKLKPEEFYNKYNEQLELEDCFDEDEFIESIEDEEDILGTLIIFYLVGNDALLQIDWKGEYDEGSTVEFVNNQLKELYDEEFTIDEEKIKYDYENDEVTVLFKEINNQLIDMGYYLVNFDDDSDQYYVGVYKVQAVKKIENQEVEGIKVQIYR